MTLEQNTTFLFFGHVGTRLTVPLVAALREHGALGILSSQGGIDLSRPQQAPVSLVPSWITNVSPPVQEMGRLYESEAEVYERLLQLLQERIIGHLAGSHQAGPGQTLLLSDMAVIPYLEHFLRRLKERLPRQTFVFVTELPVLSQRDNRVQQAYEVLTKLHNERIDNGERVVQTSLVLDAHSSVATHLQMGIELQDALASRSIVCGLTGHLYSLHNLPFATIAARLGQVGAFSGMSVATTSVASGMPTTAWKAVNWLNPKADKRGRGDIDDTVIQSKSIIKRVVTLEEGSRTPTQVSEGTIDPQQPCYLLINAPIKPDDKRMSEYNNFIRPFCQQQYPNASTIIVPTGGTRDIRQGSGYFAQAACWYPFDALRPVPAGNQALIAQEALAPLPQVAAEQQAPPQNGARRQRAQSNPSPSVYQG